MTTQTKPPSKNSLEKAKKFVSQQRSYLIGVGLGTTLIIVNTTVGLYVVNLLIESESPTNKTVQQLPVPKIDEEGYLSFKVDYLNRQTKELRATPTVNPFGTN